jgi:outer membrane protein assembly factor BamB
MQWLRALLALWICAGTAVAGDWPQWLGANRDAVSPEVVAPWTKAPAVIWRHPVGEGHSSPIVAAGRVYLHAQVPGQDAEEVLAFDAVSGKKLWATPTPRPHFTTPFGNGPRATPTVSGDRLFALGITGNLVCLDVSNGKIIWQADILKQFQAPNLTFGVSCSPLVVDDKVLINVGAKRASIVAFAADSGKVVWQALDDPATYSSPIVIGEGDRRQIIFLTQKGLVGLRPADGNVLWKFPLVDLLSESSTTPVLAGDVLIGSSVTYGSVGVELNRQDDRLAAKQLWKNSALTCYFSTPVPVGRDRVYMVTGQLIPPPQVALHCVDVRTGKDVWTRSKVGRYHASLLRTGDNKLLMLDDSGNLILLATDTPAYNELARSNICGPTWAHPALANGRLYIRDGKELLCLELTK